MAERVALPMDDGQEPGRQREAAQVAREVNTAICELEDRLTAADAHRVGFFCECGCMGIVPMPMADYRQRGGAWIEGHEPT
jgi:hypothetical protein